MSERKKNVKGSSKTTVKCWLLDRDYNPIRPDHIPASCVDKNAEGMVLEWPVSWKCKGCQYSGKDTAGRCCTAKKCPYDGTSRFLVAATLLKVTIDDRKMERYVKVEWVKEKAKRCHIGVSFAS